MRRKIAVISGLLALVTLGGFGTRSVISPTPLQAQTCGVHSGPLCASDCMRECSGGGCCGWFYYYYRASAVSDQ
jgi:hypothetical protein